MKPAARRLWASMSKQARAKALVYYCNLREQVHQNCEHGHQDLAKAI